MAGQEVVKASEAVTAHMTLRAVVTAQPTVMAFPVVTLVADLMTLSMKTMILNLYGECPCCLMQKNSFI